MVLSADRIPGVEVMAAQNRLSKLISYKLKCEYSEMCGFVKAIISLAIVRSNSLLLRGSWGKAARIWKRPDLTYGEIIALITPWQA